MKTPFDYDQECAEVIRPFQQELRELVAKIFVEVVENDQSMVFAHREIISIVEHTEILMRSYANLSLSKMKETSLPEEEKFAIAINEAFDKVKEL